MTEAAEKQALGFLGLCKRAGQVVSGQEACVNAVRGGEACLALMDAGASPNTRKRMIDACHSHDIPLYEVTQDRLGHAIGQAGCMTVALPQGGMAQKLLGLLATEPRL